MLTSIQLLHHFPNVASFTLSGPNVDKLIILINAYYHHVPPQYATLPLSRLTKVTLDGTDIQGETLIALVEQRLTQLEGGTHGVRAVLEVELYESPGVTPADWKRVTELLELGRAVTKDSSPGDVEMGR